MECLVCLLKANELFFFLTGSGFSGPSSVVLNVPVYKNWDQGREERNLHTQCTKTTELMLKRFHLPVKLLEVCCSFGTYFLSLILKLHLEKTKGFSALPTPYQKWTKSILPKAQQKGLLQSQTWMLKAAEISSTLSLLSLSGFSFNNHYSKHWGKHNF